MTTPHADLPIAVAGFAHAQTIARAVADDVFARLEAGVTEREVVAELRSRLAHHGVRSWLHHPFVWFGERSGFHGFRSLLDFFPTDRRLCAGDVVCADMAPVVDGWAADYGWSTILGHDPAYDAMRAFDESLRDRIVELLAGRPTGRDLVRDVGRKIECAGYQVRHTMYPFGILGHRLERVRTWDRFALGRPFQLPTFALHLRQWMRGVMPLLNASDRQPLEGVWAIQPHIGNGRFGVKFEDLLWVHADGAEWLLPSASRPS